MDIPQRLQPVQPVPVPAELTQLAAASVQDEWCQLLILREQVGPSNCSVTPQKVANGRRLTGYHVKGRCLGFFFGVVL